MKSLQLLFMKSLKTFFFVAAMALGAAAYGQQVVGQGYYKESDYGKFYIRLGLNLPQGQLKNAIDPSIPYYENFIGNDGGMQAGTGYNFELGRYFFFHSEPISDLFKVGLDATFLSLGYQQLKGLESENDGNPDLTTLAIKFGPVVSFNPFEDFYADVFVKIAPSMLVSINPPYHYIEGANDSYEQFNLYDDETLPFGWKSDVGVNLRYKKATLTFNYESGSIKTNSYYTTSGDGEWDDNLISGKLPMAVFQIKLGLQFF